MPETSRRIMWVVLYCLVVALGMSATVAPLAFAYFMISDAWSLLWFVPALFVMTLMFSATMATLLAIERMGDRAVNKT